MRLGGVCAGVYCLPICWENLAKLEWRSGWPLGLIQKPGRTSGSTKRRRPTTLVTLVTLRRWGLLAWVPRPWVFQQGSTCLVIWFGPVLHWWPPPSVPLGCCTLPFEPLEKHSLAWYTPWRKHPCLGLTLRPKAEYWTESAATPPVWTNACPIRWETPSTPPFASLAHCFSSRGSRLGFVCCFPWLRFSFFTSNVLIGEPPENWNALILHRVLRFFLILPVASMAWLRSMPLTNVHDGPRNTTKHRTTILDLDIWCWPRRVGARFVSNSLGMCWFLPCRCTSVLRPIRYLPAW